MLATMTDTTMTNYLPPFPETPKEKLFAPPLMFCDNWDKYNGRLFWGLLPQEIEDLIIDFLKHMLRRDVKEDLFARLLLQPSVARSRGNQSLEFKKKKEYILAQLAITEQRLDNTLHKPNADGQTRMTKANGYAWGHSGRFWEEKFGNATVETSVCHNSCSWKFTVWNTSRQWNDGDISGGYRVKWDQPKKKGWHANHPEYAMRNCNENFGKNTLRYNFEWKGNRNQARYEESYYSKEVGMINYRHSKKHLLAQIAERGYSTRGYGKYDKDQLARLLMKM